jgi:hypothetical protein
MANDPGNPTAWWVGIGGILTAVLTFLGTRFTSRNDLVATLIKDIQDLRGEHKGLIDQWAEDRREHATEVEALSQRIANNAHELFELKADLSAEKRTTARLREEIKRLTAAHVAEVEVLKKANAMLTDSNAAFQKSDAELRATARAVLQDLVSASELLSEEARAMFAGRLEVLNQQFRENGG